MPELFCLLFLLFFGAALTGQCQLRIVTTKNQTSSGILSGSLVFWSPAGGLKPYDYRPTKTHKYH